MLICGLDECGRGALAGPLVGAGIILNAKSSIHNLNDSKKITPEKRDKIYKRIIKSGAIVAVEIISARQINTRGMGWANKEIFRRIKRKMPAQEHIADGNLEIRGIKSVVKADTKIPEVMAASIVAKVFRDRIMNHLHQQYPVYGWQSNKGYGTRYHLTALAQFAPCKHHRSVFVTTAFRKTSVPAHA